MSSDPSAPPAGTPREAATGETVHDLARDFVSIYHNMALPWALWAERFRVALAAGPPAATPGQREAIANAILRGLGDSVVLREGLPAVPVGWELRAADEVLAVLAAAPPRAMGSPIADLEALASIMRYCIVGPGDDFEKLRQLWGEMALKIVAALRAAPPAGGQPVSGDARLATLRGDLLAVHRRYHEKVGCPGRPDCYVCKEEDYYEAALRAVPSGPRTENEETRVK